MMDGKRKLLNGVQVRLSQRDSVFVFKFELEWEFLDLMSAEDPTGQKQFITNYDTSMNNPFL